LMCQTLAQSIDSVVMFLSVSLIILSPNLEKKEKWNDNSVLQWSTVA